MKGKKVMPGSQAGPCTRFIFSMSTSCFVLGLVRYLHIECGGG